MKKENENLRHVSDRMRKKLLEFYQDVVPDYVVDVGKSHITLRLVDDRCDYRDYVITICHVHEFFASRRKKREPMISLGGYTGEETYLRTIALECLRWFKFVSPEEFLDKKRYPNEP